MKKVNILGREFFKQSLIAGALALVLASLTATVSHAKEVDQVITIRKVNGAARYSSDNLNWLTLRQGDVLRPGCVIQTAQNSSVDLCMGDPVIVNGGSPVVADVPNAARPGLDAGRGLIALNDKGFKTSALHLFSSTALTVTKLVCEDTGVDQVNDTQISLRAGRILGDVKKLSSASRYEIKIPSGFAAIRGTTYTVSAAGAVYCLAGSVTISYLDGQNIQRTVTVNAGMSFNPYQAPVTGQPVPVAGAGYMAPIPPAQLADLQAANSGSQPATASNFSKNGTTIYISPN